MSETGAVEALKAAFRGAVSASEALESLRERIEALDAAADPDPALLEELSRIAAGVAIAAAALRGLSESRGYGRGE